MLDFIASITVYSELAPLIKGPTSSQYLDHKFCIKQNPNHHRALSDLFSLYEVKFSIKIKPKSFDSFGASHCSALVFFCLKDSPKTPTSTGRYTHPWETGGIFDTASVLPCVSFSISAGLRRTFVCCCEVNGYFPQGFLTAEFVCSPGVFSAWLEDRLHCRQISGLALALPSPPDPGQNYADESLECNEVINSGRAWMTEVLPYFPCWVVT